MLSWQYLLYFASPATRAAGGSSTGLFAPFLVMGHYATWLGPKFVLSILLPLTVLAVYRRDVLASSAMQLAWLQFAFVAACSYLLAESRLPLAESPPSRPSPNSKAVTDPGAIQAGNIMWTGRVTTYLLYVNSTVFAQRQWTNGRRSVVSPIAFGLHEICGVVFFTLPYNWGPVS